MVGSNLKAETMSLIEKRGGIEREMNSIIDRLCQPNGGPGIAGNLVDSEGFPRSDIDVTAARADRHRLSELRNDYKDITSKIDENLQVLHSARLTPNSTVSGEGSNNQFQRHANVTSSLSQDAFLGDTHSSMDRDVDIEVPFAMVDEIADGSPSAEDGLQLGDQIVKFGNVESGEGLLQRLASEAQSNLGHAVAVVVLRQGVLTNLVVTPRAWHGRGLLGCHFQIL